MAEGERGQLSMRPSVTTLTRLRERARLLGDRHTTLAERYLAEGILMDEHPNIFIDGAMGRRPAVSGTGLDVREVVQVAADNHNGSVAETAAYLEIDPRLVESALRYYGANKDEVDEWLARVLEFNEREERMRRDAYEAFSS